MNFLITTSVTLIIIGFLIFIHELGHFLSARLSGVKVNEFSIGFGKSLLEWSGKETKYKLCLIPLGGYVQLEGEQSNTGPESFRSKPYISKLFILSAGVLMNFLVAIILFSISLAITDYKFVMPKFGDFNFTNVDKIIKAYPVTFFDISPNSSISDYIDDTEVSIISIKGYRFENFEDFQKVFNENLGREVEVETFDFDTFDINKKSLILSKNNDIDASSVYIVSIDQASPVKDLLKIGDQIISVNGVIPTSPEDFNKLIEQNQGNEVELKVLRNKEEVVIKFIPSLQEVINLNNKEVKVYLRVLLAQYEHGFGIGYDSQNNRPTYFIQYKPSVLSGLFMSYDLTRYQFVALFNIFSNARQTGDFTEVSNSFGGVAQVGDQVGQVIELQAFIFLIPLAGLISLALATFNILPFPALDGGQIVVVTIESLIRKPIPDKVLSIINTGGFILLIVFGILVTVKDVVQLGWLDVLGINL